MAFLRKKRKRNVNVETGEVFIISKEILPLACRFFYPNGADLILCSPHTNKEFVLVCELGNVSRHQWFLYSDKQEIQLAKSEQSDPA